MNWKELKDFCNNLPMSELEKKVIIWREYEAITDISSEQLKEDMYVEIGEEEENGCIPESEQILDSHYRKVYSKGHPILHENF